MIPATLTWWYQQWYVIHLISARREVTCGHTGSGAVLALSVTQAIQTENICVCHHHVMRLRYRLHGH